MFSSVIRYKKIIRNQCMSRQNIQYDDITSSVEISLFNGTSQTNSYDVDVRKYSHLHTCVSYYFSVTSLNSNKQRIWRK